MMLFSRQLFVLLLLLAPVVLHAQEQAESLPPVELKTDTLKAVQEADSTIAEVNNLIDHINTADTLISNTTSKTDTVFEASHQALSELEKAANLPNSAIDGAGDSLKFVNKVFEKEQNALDSVNRILRTPADKISNIEQKINNPTGGRVNGVTSEVNEGLDNVGINHGIDQQGGVGVSGGLRPGGQGGLLPGAPDIPGLDATTDALEKLGEAGEVLNKAQGITDQTKNIGLEVGNVSRGDFENTQIISGMAEDQLQNTEVFQTLAEEAAPFDGLMSPFANPMEAGDMQSMALGVGKQMAKNHFEGHEAKLAAAMGAMTELKGRYTDWHLLNKESRNKSHSLKGHPWQHRIYPLLNFQVINGDKVTVDLMPGATFRINTLVSVTGGGVYRTNFYKSKDNPGVLYRLGGVYFMPELLFFKTFSLLAEVERLDVERTITGVFGKTEFIDWNYMVGIRKDYDFTKHVFGNMMAMYNFSYNGQLSPYPSRFHVRFGMYYVFKTKEEREKRKRFGKN
ncbi:MULTISPECIES: hypothetical protein [unclassified Imperialibacter]|uniref:hypothetical protein n=1 Tax=unclassified Imperialibacter TaxID=2629706 RepID=UPI00125441F8|nr:MULTISPECIES: hypothetical protein [unclassified Imperialibacter]CAD5265109.1 exported hypothetical protein [Imperialibacter sp. 89]CAD5269998.1 exported hypothetical protein [Imperialibacter sp. 75]VVT09601.1 exported hypothetical protein [Imperialibacter sp. EC-SDR9]